MKPHGFGFRPENTVVVECQKTTTRQEIAAAIDLAAKSGKMLLLADIDALPADIRIQWVTGKLGSK